MVLTDTVCHDTNDGSENYDEKAEKSIIPDYHICRSAGCDFPYLFGLGRKCVDRGGMLYDSVPDNRV